MAPPEKRYNNLFKSSKRKISKLKIFADFIKMFFSTSSIHGFNYLIQKDKHPVERFIWFALVVSAVYGAAIISSLTLTRYKDNPTVISMERDRFSWNTSFPSATICPTSKVNEALLDSFLNNATGIKDKVRYRKFVIALLGATYSNLETIPEYEDINADDYMSLIMKFKFIFKPTVTNSAVNAKQYSLQETMTEMGTCYSFNSQLAVYTSPEYWNKGNWKLLPENELFYVNPLDGEVFTNVVNMSTSYQMYVHGPNEVADIASKYLSPPNGYYLQLYLNALTIFSSESTKTLRIKQRKCRFYYESNLIHSPVYSYVLCRMECRALLAKRLCGCTPHFYRKVDGERICNVTGLHCLSKYKEKLIMLKNECTCVANCDEVNYIIVDMHKREWFLGSNLQWGLKEYPKMRLRRDVIFGFSDLLVYIGGMVGLFLGCSVLSFIEIIYFFTLRLYWFVVKYRKETLQVHGLR